TPTDDDRYLVEKVQDGELVRWRLPLVRIRMGGRNGGAHFGSVAAFPDLGVLTVHDAEPAPAVIGSVLGVAAEDWLVQAEARGGPGLRHRHITRAKPKRRPVIT